MARKKIKVITMRSSVEHTKNANDYTRIELASFYLQHKDKIYLLLEQIKGARFANAFMKHCENVISGKSE